MGAGKGAHLQLTPALLGQIADSMFGAAPVPPGSQIIYQDAATVRWIDPEGFEHVAQRSLNGTDPNAGQWRETQTNRPAVLPNRGAQDFAASLQSNLQQGFGSAPTLAQLDPETARALMAISQAEQAANAQALQDRQGQLVAQLFGNRVNQSSIATGAGARFAQMAGLVGQQQQADAANRELAVRQLLTTLGQQNRELQAGLYSNLTGQQTQRDIAGGGLDLDKLRLGESARQANLGFELNQQQADMQLAEQRSMLNKILKASQIAANFAGAAGGGLGAYRALTGGK